MKHTNDLKSNTRFLNLQARKLSFLLVLMLTFSTGAFADGPEDTGGSPDENTPIDGGVSLLVAAGIAYGAIQWKSNRQAENKTKNTGR